MSICLSASGRCDNNKFALIAQAARLSSDTARPPEGAWLAPFPMPMSSGGGRSLATGEHDGEQRLTKSCAGHFSFIHSTHRQRCSARPPLLAPCCLLPAAHCVQQAMQRCGPGAAQGLCCNVYAYVFAVLWFRARLPCSCCVVLDGDGDAGQGSDGQGAYLRVARQLTWRRLISHTMRAAANVFALIGALSKRATDQTDQRTQRSNRMVRAADPIYCCNNLSTGALHNNKPTSCRR